MKTKNAEQKESVKPEQKFRSGLVCATIWKKEITKDNQKFDVYSITIDRSYKDGDEWKKTSTFNKHDLLRLQTVLNESVKYLFLNEEE